MLSSLKVTGTLLSDQVKCLDWKARDAEFICKILSNVIIEVLNKLNILLRL